MQKVYGAKRRHDGLYRIGRNKWELIYGFGKDHEEDETGYNFRHRFNHKPTAKEVKDLLLNHINALTDEKILSGFVWNEKRVWLSKENQFNFKAAYDLIFQCGGALLPIKFKFDEDEDGKPVYHVFNDLSEFTDFITNVFSFISSTLNDGWKEKDALDDVVMKYIFPN